MKRTLTLKSERLAELNTDDLHAVVGGTNTFTFTEVVTECVSYKVCPASRNVRCTWGAPSLNDTCLC